MGSEKITNALLALLLCASSIALFYLFRQNEFIADLVQHEYELQVGESAFILDHLDINANPVEITHHETLLIFISSTCETCTRNLPLYQSFYENIISRNGDIKVIGISTESIETLLSLQQKYRLSFPLVSDKDRKIFWEYRIKAAPELVFLDRDSRVAKLRQYGQSSEAFLQEVQDYFEINTALDHERQQ